MQYLESGDVSLSLDSPKLGLTTKKMHIKSRNLDFNRENATIDLRPSMVNAAKI